MSTSRTTLEIPTRGPFDLARVATMGFGHREEPDFDGVMRLAFCVDDDYRQQVGVALRQRDDVLELDVQGDADPDAVAAQVARVVSVDHDGQAYAELGRTDPVLGRLQAAIPGFRPALFYSPYEAAVWSILSARRARPQGIRVRERLVESHGRAFELAGVTLGALPSPERLLTVDSVPGLPDDRIPRLHAIAEAAAAGRLSAAHLQRLGPDEALSELQRLPGIGPFYASLIVIRGSGFADVVVTGEAQARTALLERYDLDPKLSDADYVTFCDRFRPYRTWVAVLARMTSGMDL